MTHWIHTRFVFLGAIVMLINGCALNYRHEGFTRATPSLEFEQYTIFPSLSATSHGKLGNRTGSPYHLKLVIRTKGQVSGVVQVRSAVIRDGDSAIELINRPEATVFLLHHYGQSDSYMNITIPPDIALGFEEGKELELNLHLVIHEGTKQVEIKKSFEFVGKVSQGRERFNPLFDIT